MTIHWRYSIFPLTMVDSEPLQTPKSPVANHPGCNIWNHVAHLPIHNVEAHVYLPNERTYFPDSSDDTWVCRIRFNLGSQILELEWTSGSGLLDNLTTLGEGVGDAPALDEADCGVLSIPVWSTTPETGEVAMWRVYDALRRYDSAFVPVGWRNHWMARINCLFQALQDLSSASTDMGVLSYHLTRLEVC